MDNIIGQKQKRKDADYYEMIIESGFHIYSLVTMYLETKKNADSLDEDDEMSEYLKEFTRETTTLKSAFEKSIFGQLAGLGGQFLSMGLGTLKQLKEGVMSLKGKGDSEEDPQE